MSGLTDIQKYEAMAKLDLPEPERRLISERAARRMEEFAAIEAIDTSGAEPLVTVLDVRNVLRDDVARRFISRDELLSNAPEQYGGCFQVPRTLD